MDVRWPRCTTTAARAQVIKKVGPYIENPDFTPKAIEKASVACKAICMRLAASRFHESGFFSEFEPS